MSRKVQEKLDLELAFLARQGDLCRGRSLAIGVSLNGVIEIVIRHNNGQCAWVVLNTHEVVTLVHQIAAALGCCVTLEPQKVNHKNQPGLDNLIGSNKDEPMAIEKTVQRRSTKRTAKTA
jgi:hypothetical protein